MKSTLVTSYVNPDLDGVASAVAYVELLQEQGRNAVAGMMGTIQDEAKYMLKRFGGTQPTIVANADDYDEVILVDTCDPAELEGTIAVDKVTEIIDHRAVHHASAFPNAKTQIELIGATATLISEKFIRSSSVISKSSAALLFGAIISNTLNFQGSMTTNRDRDAAAWLNLTAKLPEDYWKEQFMAKSDMSGDTLARRIEDDFAQFVLGGHKVGIAELELMGAKKLLDARGDETVGILERLMKELHLDLIFLNTTELERASTWLVTADEATQKLLSNVFHTQFINNVVKLPHPLMRKQIVPLLKDALG